MPDKSKLILAIASQLRNSFCPTGPGGGVDPSCSPSEGSKPVLDKLKELHEGFRDSTYEQIDEMMEEIGRGTKAEVVKLAKDFGIPGNFRSKAHAVKEIRTRVATRKSSWERTRWR